VADSGEKKKKKKVGHFNADPSFSMRIFQKKTQSATRRESNAATLQRCGQNLLPLCAA
jgi:hypothetical protein